MRSADRGTRGRWTDGEPKRTVEPVSGRGYGILLGLLGLLLVLGMAKLGSDAMSVAAQDDVVGGSAAPGGPCEAAGLIPIGDSGRCTHGPDEPPPGVVVGAEDPPLITAGADPQITCVGDGQSGNRVQVLYVRASDVPARDNFRAIVRSIAANADQIYRDSAAETGGSRSIRFVHDNSSTCVISVTEVVLTPTGDDDFYYTETELEANGFNRTDRKYLAFVDASALCGIGDLIPDDRRNAVNRSNVGPSFARVDTYCWTPDVAAHG